MNGLGWLLAMLFLIIAAAALAAKVSRAFNPIIINPAFTPPPPCEKTPKMVLNPKFQTYLYQQSWPKYLMNEPFLIPESELPGYVA